MTWILIFHTVKVLKLQFYVRRILQRQFLTKNVFVLMELMLHGCYIVTAGYICSCVLFYLYTPQEGQKISSEEQFLLLVVKTMSQILQNDLGITLNMLEAISACIISMMGLYLFLYYMAAFTAAVFLEKYFWNHFAMIFRNCGNFMENKSFPKVLRQRVINYLKCQWNANKCSDPLDLIRYAPPEIAKSWNFMFYKELLEKLDIFKDCDDGILKYVCSKCKLIWLPPGEVIIYGGMIVNNIYILESGFAEMIHPENGVLHSYLSPRKNLMFK